ncbi:unnamed protein product, partial [Cyprideis torosa]
MRDQLKADESAFRKATKKIQIEASKDIEHSSKIVAEFYNTYKSFDEGGDYIDVMGKQRHVCGYLKDFLFDPSRVYDKVSQLSGGQNNRLMLAKILANPKSCLILDEPTNDLDMDTLDMLEDILMQYK